MLEYISKIVRLSLGLAKVPILLVISKSIINFKYISYTVNSFVDSTISNTLL